MESTIQGGEKKHLCDLNLPIHKQYSLHLIRPPLKTSNKNLCFSAYRTCTFLVRFIPSYFIFLLLILLSMHDTLKN